MLVQSKRVNSRAAVYPHRFDIKMRVPVILTSVVSPPPAFSVAFDQNTAERYLRLRASAV